MTSKYKIQTSNKKTGQVSLSTVSFFTKEAAKAVAKQWEDKMPYCEFEVVTSESIKG